MYYDPIINVITALQATDHDSIILYDYLHLYNIVLQWKGYRTNVSITTVCITKLYNVMYLASKYQHHNSTMIINYGITKCC